VKILLKLNPKYSKSMPLGGLNPPLFGPFAKALHLDPALKEPLKLLEEDPGHAPVMGEG
jgi:hypothetical protein